MADFEKRKKSEDPNLSNESVNQGELRDAGLSKEIDKLISFASKFNYKDRYSDFQRVVKDTKTQIENFFIRNQDCIDAIYEGAVRKLLKNEGFDILRGLAVVLNYSGSVFNTEKITSKKEIVNLYKEAALSQLSEGKLYWIPFIWAEMPSGSYLTGEKELGIFTQAVVKALDSQHLFYNMDKILSVRALLSDEDKDKIFTSKIVTDAFQSGLIKQIGCLDGESLKRLLQVYGSYKKEMPEEFLAVFKSEKVVNTLKALIIEYLPRKQDLNLYLKNNIKLLMTGIIANPKDVILSDEIRRTWSNALVSQVNGNDTGRYIQFNSLLKLVRELGVLVPTFVNTPEMTAAIQTCIISAFNQCPIDCTHIIVGSFQGIWDTQKLLSFVQNEVPDSAWKNSVAMYLSNPNAKSKALIECIGFLKLKLGTMRAIDIVTSPELKDIAGMCLRNHESLIRGETIRKFSEDCVRLIGKDGFGKLLESDLMKEWFLFTLNKSIVERHAVSCISTVEIFMDYLGKDEVLKLILSDETYFQCLSDHVNAQSHPQKKLSDFYEMLKEARDSKK